MLAFDFGTRRIGVAVGDFETRLAHPLTVVAARDNRARFAAIARLVAEWRPVLFVLGVPQQSAGAEHPLAHLVHRFAQRLTGRFGVRVEFVDERLTSHEAERALRESGARAARLKAGLDAVAAQRILQTFFESTADREVGKS